jgi:hypothetical protein
MATNFPTSLDTFTNPNSGNTLDSPSHSIQHSDINDAVEAIEAKIGVGSSTAGSATAGYALVNTSGGTTAYSLLGVSGLSSGTAVANTVLTANGSGGVAYQSTNQGLTFLYTTTFTSVANGDIPTGTFTSAYQNYRIIYEGTAGAGDIAMRLGDGGVFNATANNYRWNMQFATYTGSTITGSNSSTTQTAFLLGNANGFYSSIDLYSPFDSARNTGMTYLHARSDYGFMTGGGAMTVTTSFSQVRFLATGGGDISGTVYVYGYNK